MIEPDYRPHQLIEVGQISGFWRAGARAVLYQAATGSGKTVTGVGCAVRAAMRNKRIMWITHRRELCEQVSQTMDRYGLPHGIVAAGYPERREAPVHICSIDTLRRRLDKIVDLPQLVIWDEARHLGAKTWRAVYEHFGGAYHLGLDATPMRQDGSGLGDFFQQIVHGPPISDLINAGYLSKYKLYVPSTPNLEGLHVRMGEYIQAEVEEIFDKPTIVGNAVAHLKQFANEKRTLVFCVSIEASKRMAAAFLDAGFVAAHMDGACHDDLRRTIMKDFREGRLQVLCSVSLFTEGLDIPGVECVIIARPTMSVALYLQMIGRGLRQFPGKDHCVILDMAANYAKHGLPDDEREWTLAGRDKRRRSADEKPPPVRVCPECWSAQAPGPPRCRHCGHVFPVQSREVAEHAGTLSEITPEQLAKKRARIEVGRSKSLEDLQAIERARGYRAGWAQHVWDAKQRKRAVA